MSLSEPVELDKYILVFSDAIKNPDKFVSNFLNTTPGSGRSVVEKHSSFGTDGAESFMLLRLPPEDQRSDIRIEPDDLFLSDLLEFDRISKQAFNKYLDIYGINLSEPTEVTHSGMRHYATGGFVGPHQDYSHRDVGTPNFTVTLNAYLTDDYEGGEIAFLSDDTTAEEPNEREIKISYRPNKGDIVVFPSVIWHKVLPVTSGDRYNINTVLVESEVPTWYDKLRAEQTEV